jgi:hypothetical protein
LRYEIRAMGLGEVLDTAFQLVRDRAALLIGIALTVTFPTQLLLVLVEKAASQGSGPVIVGVAGLALFMIVVSPVVSAAITHAVSETYLDREVGYADSLGRGFKLLLPLVGTALLMMLILLPATLLLVVPGLYLMFAYLLVNQVIVIEGLVGWSALKRSFELTRQNMLRVLAVYLVSVVIMSVVSMGLSLLSAQVPYLQVVLDAVVQGILTAYMSAALVVLYFDIRCRKEAFDLEHLAGRVGGAEAPAAPTA